MTFLYSIFCYLWYCFRLAQKCDKSSQTLSIMLTLSKLPTVSTVSTEFSRWLSRWLFQFLIFFVLVNNLIFITILIKCWWFTPEHCPAPIRTRHQSLNFPPSAPTTPTTPLRMIMCPIKSQKQKQTIQLLQHQLYKVQFSTQSTHDTCNRSQNENVFQLKSKTKKDKSISVTIDI